MPVLEKIKRLLKWPKPGERTGGQRDRSGLLGYVAIGSEPSTPPGTFQTYRRMRGNPTIALARAVATMPIRSATWSVQAKDRAPKDAVPFIQGQIERLWWRLVRDMLLALDYGLVPFEKVWQVDREGRLVYRKIKYLLPEKTTVLIDETTGAFAGLRQGDVTLPPENAFVLTYDGEGDDLYGRSRHENIREDAWAGWTDTAKKMGLYAKKTAGVIPLIEYPEGAGRDAAGSEEANVNLAKNVLRNLTGAEGVAVPNVFSKNASDLIRAGVDVQDLKAWHISFLESRGQHGRDFIDMLRHYESLMLRGWLVPERAVTEGQYGTKAEAQAHGELALAVANEVFLEILRHVNSYVINPLLVYNYGPDAADSICLSPGGLDPALKAFFRSLVEKVLAAPPNVELFLKTLNLDALLDHVGLPRAEGHREVAEGGK